MQLDTLIVSTEAEEAGSFMTHWQWVQKGWTQALSGVVRVHVPAHFIHERRTIAEARAIRYLLEERSVHGKNRLGAGIKLVVSTVELSRACSKRMLKQSGGGKALSTIVGIAAGFLATKYFEMIVEFGKPRPLESRKSEALVVIDQPSVITPLTHECLLLEMPVGITRHAMHRYIQRLDQKLMGIGSEDLSAVPDQRWSAAWQWFKKILSSPKLSVAKLIPYVEKKFNFKYGSDCIYLEFQDAGAILVLKKTNDRFDVVTVLHDTPYTKIIDRDACLVGQQIVKSRAYKPRFRKTQGQD